MTKKSWVVDVQEDPVTGDAIIEFPQDLLEQAGWKEGDVLDWKDNSNGSYSISKKIKQDGLKNENI